MNKLHDVYASMITPFIWTLHQVRLLGSKGVKQRAAKVLLKFLGWVLARPKLKCLASQVAYRLGIDNRLKSLVCKLIASDIQSEYLGSPQQTPVYLTSLTPRARQIYKDLKLGIEIKQTGGA